MILFPRNLAVSNFVIKLKELEVEGAKENRRFSIKRIRSLTKTRERSMSREKVEHDAPVTETVNSEEVSCLTVDTS